MVIFVLLLTGWAISNLFVWTDYRLVAYNAIDVITLVVCVYLGIWYRSWAAANVAVLSGFLLWLHTQPMAEHVYLLVANCLFFTENVVVITATLAPKKI